MNLTDSLTLAGSLYFIFLGLLLVIDGMTGWHIAEAMGKEPPVKP